jgi:hypothetical protein
VAERVTVHHLTRTRCLPLIEEDGLRTRGELGAALGPLDPIDAAARGKFAHGKRVSAWLTLDAAVARVSEFGAGHVEWDVDPARTLAAPASLRADATAYWAAAKPLKAWLADGDVPEDLEVHVDRGVRAKYVRLMAPLLTDEDLGEWAALIAAVADEDRLSAKALMHLTVIASAGDFDGQIFGAACALAWRDVQDARTLVPELLESDPDKVASAALAMYGAAAPGPAEILRTQLDETRAWADENGLEHGQAVLMRTALVLEQVELDDVDIDPPAANDH